MKYRLLPVFALFWLAASSFAEDQPDRKCVAFFVGIERYDEGSLNNLRFVGEDTFAVWNRLKELTRLDEARSKLFIVDREKNGDLPQDAKQLRKTFTWTDFEQEFREFLVTVKSDDLVVIYLQGHGLKKRRAQDAGVFFPCTDYKTVGNTFTGGVKINDLLGSLQDELGVLPTVQTVFFANMCRAGASAGAMGESPVTTEQFEKALLEGTLKPFRTSIAYIPAAAGSEDAFELPNLGRSEFAYNLLDALGGAAADDLGTVKTMGVLRYLQKKGIKSKPAEPANFAADITICRVLEREARIRRFLGNSVMAVALDASQARQELLLRLADSHFARCTEICGTDRSANILSRMQCKLLLGQDPSELLRQLPGANAVQVAPPADPAQEVAEELAKLDPHGAPAPFVAAIIAGPNTVDGAEPNIVAWKNFIKGRPGYVGLASFSTDPTDFSFRAGSAALLNWCQEQAKLAPTNDLLLIYSGAVRDPQETHKLAPVSEELVWSVAQSWPARVVVVWDAPFGGVLKESMPSALTFRVSMLLTASQTNGMTLDGTTNGTTSILLDCLRAGVSKSSLEQAYARFRSTFMDLQLDQFSLAKPEFIGTPHSSLGGTSLQTGVRKALGSYGLPEPWWAMRFALDGRLEPLHWAERPVPFMDSSWSAQLAKLSAEPVQPFADLQRATLLEALRRHGEASEAYAGFEATTNSPPTSLDPDLQALQRYSLEDLAAFKQHLQARERSLEWKIHAVLAPVCDYQSPLIGRLSGPANDARVWSRVLKELFGERLHEYTPKNGSAEEIWKALDQACTACGTNDTLLFLFSGRGFATIRDRYLIAEDDQPFMPTRLRVLGTENEPNPPPKGELPLSEISLKLARCPGAHVVLLDCQFTDSKQRREPLQKHLLSIWQWSEPSDFQVTGPDGHERESGQHGDPFANPARAVLADGVTRLQPYYLAAAPADSSLVATRSIYIWWAGELTETLNLSSTNETFVSSDFSRFLIQSLQHSHERSYHDWLREAAQLNLQNSGRKLVRATPNPGNFVAQGPMADPLFISDSGKLPLRLLLSGYYVKLANLNLALNICAGMEAILNRPVDRLTRALLLTTRAALVSRGGLPDGQDDARKDNEAAKKLIEDLGIDIDRLQESALLGVYIEAGIRAKKATRGASSAIEFVIQQGGHYPDGVYTPELIDELSQLAHEALVQGAEQFLDQQVSDLSELSKDSPAALQLLKEFQKLRVVRTPPPDLAPVRN